MHAPVSKYMHVYIEPVLEHNYYISNIERGEIYSVVHLNISLEVNREIIPFFTALQVILSKSKGENEIN